MALADLVKIARIRWAVEEDFANGKDAVGLNHTQAGRYRSRRRHVVLAMAALALLAVIAGLDRRAHPDPTRPDPILPACLPTVMRPRPRTSARSP